MYTTSLNYTALWWNPQESGWGLNINHQSDTLFATLFTYAADNAPLWLAATNTLQTDGSFRGDLYRVLGPPFNATNWTQVSSTPVGSMSIRFNSDHTGTVSYTVGTAAVTKSIEKQIFSSRPPTCMGTTASRASAANYQDLWWNPQESGWGINLTHQDTTIFATLFTFDSAGRDLWLVATSTRQANGTYSGDLYSVRGPVFSAQPWGAITASPVGSLLLTFSNGESGMLTYTVNGSAVTKQITREVFGQVRPLCQ